MRGCERKIILLKGTESQMFDEAYFLVRRDFENRAREEFVREAERIIDRNTTRFRSGEKWWRLAFFAAGFLFGAALLFTLAM